VNVAVFEARNGAMNSRATATFRLGVDSVIFIDPSPILLFPRQR
jgi:hypothetical protein